MACLRLTEPRPCYYPHMKPTRSGNESGADSLAARCPCGNPSRAKKGGLCNACRQRATRERQGVTHKRSGRVPPPRDLARFISKVGPVDPETGCQEWTGGRVNGKYGRFTEDYVPQEAHRLAYAIEYGEVPEGMWVLHSCDNPPCCNPAHLRLGGNTENVADRVARGRGLVGQDHPMARLTEQDVLKIRAAVAAGEDARAVATKYGLQGRSSVYLVLSGRTWGHLPGTVRINKARTQVRGEKAGLAKLTANQVLEARHRYRATDVTLSELAAEYGLKKSAMRQAITGKTWAHLPDAVPAGTRGHTGATGERSGSASLTADQVREIRRRAAAGETQLSLADVFGVRHGTISKIVRRERWAHID